MLDENHQIAPNETGAQLPSRPAPEQTFVEQLEKALLDLNTRIVTQSFPGHAADAKHVMISVTDPGPRIGIEPLIDELICDPRCKTLSLMIGGVADQDLAAKLSDSGFTEQLNAFSPAGYFEGTREFLKQFPVDVWLTTPEGALGPQTLIHSVSRELFPVQRFALLFEAPDTTGGLVFHGPGGENARREVSQILCNDPIARDVARGYFPELSESNITVTGSGQYGSVARADSAALREKGRQLLGVQESEIALLYLGDISSESNLAADFNERTCIKTVDAVASFAADHLSQKFVLMLRPHPRDPSAAVILNYARKFATNDNLRFIDASLSSEDRAVRLGIDEACYGADALLSLARNELFKSSLRGIPGIFLGFSESGLGGDLLSHVLPKPVADGLRSAQTIQIIDSESSLISALGHLNRGGFKLRSQELPPFDPKKMADALLTD